MIVALVLFGGLLVGAVLCCFFAGCLCLILDFVIVVWLLFSDGGF